MRTPVGPGGPGGGRWRRRGPGGDVRGARAAERRLLACERGRRVHRVLRAMRGRVRDPRELPAPVRVRVGRRDRSRRGRAPSRGGSGASRPHARPTPAVAKLRSWTFEPPSGEQGVDLRFAGAQVLAPQVLPRDRLARREHVQRQAKPRARQVVVPHGARIRPGDRGRTRPPRLPVLPVIPAPVSTSASALAPCPRPRPI